MNCRHFICNRSDSPELLLSSLSIPDSLNNISVLCKLPAPPQVCGTEDSVKGICASALLQFYPKSLVYSHRNLLPEGVLFHRLLFKLIHCHQFSARVHNPVFSDAGRAVLKQLDEIICPLWYKSLLFSMHPSL